MKRVPSLQAAEKLKQGISVIIFPEATNSNQKAFLEPKTLAIRSPSFVEASKIAVHFIMALVSFTFPTLLRSILIFRFLKTPRAQAVLLTPVR